jgi:hypothetical protein
MIFIFEMRTAKMYAAALTVTNADRCKVRAVFSTAGTITHEGNEISATSCLRLFATGQVCAHLPPSRVTSPWENVVAKVFVRNCSDTRCLRSIRPNSGLTLGNHTVHTLPTNGLYVLPYTPRSVIECFCGLPDRIADATVHEPHVSGDDIAEPGIPKCQWEAKYSAPCLP